MQKFAYLPRRITTLLHTYALRTQTHAAALKYFAESAKHFSAASVDCSLVNGG